MYSFGGCGGILLGLIPKSVYDVVRVSTMRASSTCWCGGGRVMPVLGSACFRSVEKGPRLGRSPERMPGRGLWLKGFLG